MGERVPGAAEPLGWGRMERWAGGRPTLLLCLAPSTACPSRLPSGQGLCFCKQGGGASAPHGAKPYTLPLPLTSLPDPQSQEAVLLALETSPLLLAAKGLPLPLSPL